MGYNIILYIICGISINSWILPLYSVVAYAAALKTVDFIVEGFDRAKCAVIITNQADDICKALSEEFECGSTRLVAQGGYSGEEKNMIYFIVNRFQVTRMRDIIHEIDKNAFIIISEVADVFSANMK